VATTKKRQPNPLLIGIGAAVVALLIVVVIVCWHPLIALFKNPLETRHLIAHAGPWGPVVFIWMQIMQVLIAPIPGQVTGFVGGFIFGEWWGTLYAMIGLVIGSALVFLLSRKLGRPFVERFVDKKTIDRFDYIANKHGVMILFFIFLLPFFPDDLICYMAGLTRMRFSTFLVITTIGRLPSMFAISLAASGLAEAKLQVVIAVSVVIAFVAALVYWQRKRIEQFIKQQSK
jgi:uncharacterized membrane protein YdjX (TVP38/TMEM64 family)